ncbi:type II toxin-antitoxin system RelE/ParE family toxin [Nitrosomonas sp.]|uniref:type II toxin-antitoxin system RelE/ParE family toxin n=1 Tax=Nitrosomonas sp. TaxID=42353 RepID=UPI002731B4AA|nr:type II toxin-antitoxin system RelE/ParE family toxin [Nitrosomonas sp.]MDP2223735.1 type II toxin-antitoxin system RelE/ParE family toxin [Nitrosomonas sp.]
MGKFHLTNRAVTDLSEIADFTIQTFGVEQARFYRDGLNNCFEILAENPQLGRSAAELASNLKRFEYQSHIVFYISKDASILIVRILHQRMDLKRHLPFSIKE